MPKRQPGLGVDPLAAPRRIAPVISTAPVHEDDTAGTDDAPATPAPPESGARKSTARGGAGSSAEPVAHRPEGSVARRGPMSMEAGAPKKSYSFYVDPNLLEEARDTVVFLSSDPEGPRNLSALIEEGLRREIVRLQDELHDGQAFPHRRVALRRGGNTRDM